MKLTISELQAYGIDMLRTVSEICERNGIRWYMAYGSALGAIRHHGPIPWDADIDIYVPEPNIDSFVSIMEAQLPSMYWVDYKNNQKHPRCFPRIGLSGYETEVLHIDVYRLGGFPTDSQEYKRFVKYSRYLYVAWKARSVDINYYYPDRKRRIISKTVKAITAFIPTSWLLNQLDKQANRIPFDEAVIVASPLTTMSPRRMIDRHIFDESILVDYADFKVRVPKEYERYLETVFGNWRELPPVEEREKHFNQIYDVRERIIQ